MTSSNLDSVISMCVQVVFLPLHKTNFCLFQQCALQTIVFDDFQVWEGRCPPDKEPFSQTLVKPVAKWKGMRHDKKGDTVLNVSTIFEKASTGGGCAKFEIENLSPEDCDVYEVELNIRPSWGTLSERDGDVIIHGIKLLDVDANAGTSSCVDTEKPQICTARQETCKPILNTAGWFHLQSDNRTIVGKETVERAGACVVNYQGAKYLPEDLGSHVTSHAVCVAGPAATHKESAKKPIYDPFKATRTTGGRGWVRMLLIVLGVIMVSASILFLALYSSGRMSQVRSLYEHATIATGFGVLSR